MVRMLDTISLKEDRSPEDIVTQLRHMQHDHGFDVLHTEWPLSHAPSDSRSCLDSSSAEGSEVSHSREEVRDGGWHKRRRTRRQRSSAKSTRAPDGTDQRHRTSPKATDTRHSASPASMSQNRYSIASRGPGGESGRAETDAEVASGGDAESVMSSSSQPFARRLKSVKSSHFSPAAAARQPVPLSDVVVASPRTTTPTASSSEIIRQVDAQIGSHGRRNLVRHVTGGKRRKAPRAGRRSPHQASSAPGSAAGMIGSLTRQHASLPMLLLDDRMQISKV